MVMNVFQLQEIVDKSWHFLCAKTYHNPAFGPAAKRLPHQKQEYGYSFGSFIGDGIVLKILTTGVGEPHYLYLNPATLGACEVIADWGLHGKVWQDKGEILANASIRSYDVSLESKTPTFERKLVSPERRFLGRTISSAKYQESRSSATNYLPVFVDSAGQISNSEGNNERFLGMLLEFHDPRFDPRNCTTQYYVAMPESVYKKLLEWIKKDPVAMLHLYGQSFPEHRHSPGLHAELPHMQNFFYVETPEQANSVRRQLFG